MANILGVPINSTQLASLLNEINDLIEEKPGFKAKNPLVIFTPNPEFLVASQKDKIFFENLKKSDINIPDGFGLVVFSRLSGQPVEERVSGADLVSGLLKMANEKGWEIGIAGARRGDKEEVALLLKRLEEKYPGVEFINLDDPKFKILNSRPPGFALPQMTCNVGQARQSGQVKFEIVLACHGMVKQEEWILENKNKIKAKIFIGIGGSLDFLTGFSSRAPLVMRKIGLEWFWRGLTKPGHWKRALTAAVVFPWLVIKERLNSQFSNSNLQ
ncbi:WecB/TagA/CpsF family glycosyltransferase [Patescibacteria group bacterium]|nr:WecB/TagA/CpsF family glycosyltransferase [Patescibacteria group bacterium]